MTGMRSDNNSMWSDNDSTWRDNNGTCSDATRSVDIGGAAHGARFRRSRPLENEG
jgi:hypothetical protein